MSVVLGIGASHTTLMNTNWDAVAHLDRALAFRQGLADANARLRAARPDAVVIIGPNHFRGLWLDLMPAFLLGVGDVVAAGEHGTPEGALRTDPALALGLLDDLYDAGFDPAFSARMTIDHGITHAVQYVLDGIDVPVVPLVVNLFAPPLPRFVRCRALGAALGRSLARRDRRIAIISSGGLSHSLPFPDWRAPASDDDAYLVNSWIEGRGRWQEFEPRRRGIVVASEPRLVPDFDTEFLAAFAAGALPEWAAEPDRERTLVARGGNGANEIRSWLVMAAACGDAPGETLAYSAMPEWKTGMGVAVIDRPTEPA